jgi:hypothetical protein
LNADAVATFGARPARETPQVADSALIRVEAEHPVESQLLPGTLQQELAVAMFGRSTCLDVSLPRPISQDQGDFGVIAEQLHRPVSASVVVGDDRVDMPADKIQRIAQDKRLVANAGDSDQEMLLRQKFSIADNHPLRVAKWPRSYATIAHSVTPTINPRTIMGERRDAGKRQSRPSIMGAPLFSFRDQA